MVVLLIAALLVAAAAGSAQGREPDPPLPPMCVLDPETGECIPPPPPPPPPSPPPPPPPPSPPPPPPPPPPPTPPPPPPPASPPPPPAPPPPGALPADYTYDDGDDVGGAREGPLFYSVSIGNCWRSTWSDQKGRAFYRRKVYLRVSWCARDGKLTFWGPETWPEVGSFCAVSWGPVATREAGGVGSFSVTVKARAQFTCRFIQLIPDQTSEVEVDVKYKADGTQEDV